MRARTGNAVILIATLMKSANAVKLVFGGAAFVKITTENMVPRKTGR
jgi:hypothetical protein